MLDTRFRNPGVPVETSSNVTSFAAALATNARFRSGATPAASGCKSTARPLDSAAELMVSGTRLTELLEVFVMIAVLSDSLGATAVGSAPTESVDGTVMGLVVRFRMEAVEAPLLETAAKPVRDTIPTSTGVLPTVTREVTVPNVGLAGEMSTTETVPSLEL